MGLALLIQREVAVPHLCGPQEVAPGVPFAFEPLRLKPERLPQAVNAATCVGGVIWTSTLPVERPPAVSGRGRAPTESAPESSSKVLPVSSAAVTTSVRW